MTLCSKPHPQYFFLSRYFNKSDEMHREEKKAFHFTELCLPNARKLMYRHHENIVNCLMIYYALWFSVFNASKTYF
jgi:hypothetical protein